MHEAGEYARSDSGYGLKFTATDSRMDPVVLSFERVVAEITLVLAAAAIVLNLSKDLYERKPRSGGLVPVPSFLLASRRADRIRSAIPAISRLLLIFIVVLAGVSVGSLFDIGLAIEVGGQPIRFFSQGNFVQTVTLFNLVLIVGLAYIVHEVCWVRHEGGSVNPEG